MVKISKSPLYRAGSKMEAQSWIDTIGKSEYPSQKLVIHPQGNQWHVYKG